jgi:hypothetical protein
MSTQTKSKKVRMQLVGLDGNAFSIMGAFQQKARKQGWTEREIREVLNEAMSGDHNHLLATIMDNVDMPDDDEENS